jgi:RNA polymerase sigma-70 factor (ECF subfamily)
VSDNPAFDEDALVQRARSGELAAFNSLVLHYQNAIYNLCLKLTGKPQSAEDAAQECFISAWRNLGGLRGSFRPWLMRIAANACTDELRRHARRPSSSLDLALEGGMPEPDDRGPSPEDAALSSDLRERLEGMLSQLPFDQRLAIVLSDVEGLDYSEIAQVTKASLGTVKSRIARGRARLRDLLRTDGELLPAHWRLEDRDSGGTI